MNERKKIAVIGLGYVGLPLAVEFAKKYAVTGFDIKEKRIEELRAGNDNTLEVNETELLAVLKKENNNEAGFFSSSQVHDIADCTIYIITVPTPIDKYRRPDLNALYAASKTAGSVLKKDDVVIYESTVYPGVTEDECVPVLQQTSGLQLNKDFFVGYSPERINPGDTEHTISKNKKITSGSTPPAAKFINDLYTDIITAGTHATASIKIAEAAKVIENAQRDINIAFVNELAKIFNKLELDTSAILEAAATKWNFLPFKPGLVGGHCIGVDPYYLAQKAQDAGYHPEIILAGRRLNDSMGAYVADEVIKQMVRQEIKVNESEVLVLGFTFKENCPDARNTKVIDIIKRLEEYHANVHVYDPWVNAEAVMQEYGIICETQSIHQKKYDAVIVAVAHTAFLEMNFSSLCADNCVLYDVKSVLPLSFKAIRL